MLLFVNLLFRDNKQPDKFVLRRYDTCFYRQAQVSMLFISIAMLSVTALENLAVAFWFSLVRVVSLGA